MRSLSIILFFISFFLPAPHGPDGCDIEDRVCVAHLEQDISDSNDADGGAASGKEFDDTVKAFLELNEGNENTPYEDSLGNWTVGIGHYIGKTLPERFKNPDGTPKKLTDTQVQMLFEKDYKEHSSYWRWVNYLY